MSITGTARNEVAAALVLTMEADKLLDRAREMLNGNRLMENETHAICWRATESVAVLRQQLELITSTASTLADLPIVEEGKY